MARREEIRLTVDPDMLVWLRAEAKRRRVSMSHIVRDLILQAMPEEAKTQ
jgi:hypothetical protein